MAKPAKTAYRHDGGFFVPVAIIIFVVTVLLCLYGVATGQYSYCIIDGDNVYRINSYESDPLLAIEEAGITLYYGDDYSLSQSHRSITVQIHRTVCVTLIVDGNTSIIATNGKCVRDVLAQVGVQWDEDDILSCDPGTLLQDGMTVTLTTVSWEYTTCQIPTGCNVVYVYNPAEADGSSNVIVSGSSGLDCVVFKDTYVGGVLTGRERCDCYTVVPATDRVIELGTGTAAQPYLVTADGRTRPLPEVSLTQSAPAPSQGAAADWSGEGDEGDSSAG